MRYSIPAPEKQVAMEPGDIPIGGALGTQMLTVSRHHDFLNVTVTLGSGRVMPGFQVQSRFLKRHYHSQKLVLAWLHKG